MAAASSVPAGGRRPNGLLSPDGMNNASALETTRVGNLQGRLVTQGVEEIKGASSVNRAAAIGVDLGGGGQWDRTATGEVNEPKVLPIGYERDERKKRASQGPVNVGGMVMDVMRTISVEGLQEKPVVNGIKESASGCEAATDIVEDVFVEELEEKPVGKEIKESASGCEAATDTVKDKPVKPVVLRHKSGRPVRGSRRTPSSESDAAEVTSGVSQIGLNRRPGTSVETRESIVLRRIVGDLQRDSNVKPRHLTQLERLDFSKCRPDVVGDYFDALKQIFNTGSSLEKNSAYQAVKRFVGYSKNRQCFENLPMKQLFKIFQLLLHYGVFEPLFITDAYKETYKETFLELVTCAGTKDVSDVDSKDLIPTLLSLDEHYNKFTKNARENIDVLVPKIVEWMTDNFEKHFKEKLDNNTCLNLIRFLRRYMSQERVKDLVTSLINEIYCTNVTFSSEKIREISPFLTEIRQYYPSDSETRERISGLLRRKVTRDSPQY